MNSGRLDSVTVFFSLGRTIANLRASGNKTKRNEPSRNDALQILARASANNGSSRFTSHIGAGSIEQCFACRLSSSEVRF